MRDTVLGIKFAQLLDLSGKFTSRGLCLEQVAFQRFKSLSLLDQFLFYLVRGHLCDVVPPVVVFIILTLIIFDDFLLLCLAFALLLHIIL